MCSGTKTNMDNNQQLALLPIRLVVVVLQFSVLESFSVLPQFSHLILHLSCPLHPHTNRSVHFSSSCIYLLVCVSWLTHK